MSTDAAEIFRSRLDALRTAFQTTGRILTDDSKLTVFFDYQHFRGSSLPPAYCSGNQVTLRTSLVPDIEKKTGLVLMTGLTYHEFSHIMFSPMGRKAGLIDVTNMSQAKQQAYRTLEEGRVEMLMQAKYGKVAKYFAYPVVSYLVNDSSQHDTAFLLTHGRKYLPKDIRDMFRTKFEEKFGTPLTQQFAKIIDQYLSVVYPRDKHLGMLLISQFAELCENNRNINPPDLQHEEENNGSSRPMDGRTQSTLSRKMIEAVIEQQEKEENGKDGSGFREEESDSDDDSSRENESNADDDLENESGDSEDSLEGGEESDEEPEDGGSGQDGASQVSGDADDSSDESGTGDDENNAQNGSGDQGGSGESGGATGDSSDDADEIPNDSVVSHDGAGKGHGNDLLPAPLTSQEINDTLEDLLMEIEESNEVSQEVQRLTTVMNNSNMVQTSLRPMKYREDLVTPEMRVVSGKIRTEFSRLWANLDPGWNYGEPYGRLNIGRAVTANDIDDYESMYDSWDEGLTESAGVELFMCGDVSSSMNGGPVEQMSQALWTIGNACSAIDAKVTVTTFSDFAMSLYERVDRIDDGSYRRVNANGGTMPINNLHEAHKIFSRSDQPNKILIMVTDGQWDGASTEYAKLFDSMSDVTKCCILITSPYSYFGLKDFRYRGNFNITAQVNNASEITPVIAEVVNSTLRRVKR